MIDDDARVFNETIVGLFEAMGFEAPTATARRLWWESLKGVDLDKLTQAASEYLRTRRERPTVAALLELADPSQYPAPEEAWNICPKSEAETALVFPEMLTALSACCDSLDAGDRIGARKAFLEVYQREIRGKVGRPAWFISDANNLIQEQREQVRFELIERYPERAGSQQAIAHQAMLLECATGHERGPGGMVAIQALITSREDGDDKAKVSR